MVRDEKLYPQPDEFLPERFLVDMDEQTKKRMNPRNFVFGFGRRYEFQSIFTHSCFVYFALSMIDVAQALISLNNPCGFLSHL